MCTRMFTSLLFIRAQTGNSSEKWINKPLYLHTFSKNQNELLKHTITWMDLTGTMLNEEPRHKREHTVYVYVYVHVYVYVCV